MAWSDLLEKLVRLVIGGGVTLGFKHYYDKLTRRRRRMPNQERGEEQLSVRDMPLVDRYLQCALPVLFIDREHPAYPGIGGTCFVVRYRDRTLLLTAEHVVGGAVAESIKVPARFNTWLECYSIARIGRAAIKDESDPDWLDVAVLVPAGEPEFDPAQVVPLELDTIAISRRCVTKPYSQFAGIHGAAGSTTRAASSRGTRLPR